jgi:DNA repair exonuclease SbcCD nuclease subunit
MDGSQSPQKVDWKSINMRFLLYSDLQLHPFKEFSNLVGGVNDRLLDHFAVLDQIYDYARNHGIRYIVFGGDMFEVRTRVDVIAAKMLAAWKHKVSLSGIMQLDLVGNHDLYDRSTLHNSIDLYGFIEGQSIFAEPRWFGYHNQWAILFVPYMHSLEEVKAGINLPPPDKMGFTPERSIAIIHYGLYDVPTETHHIIRDQGYETEGQIRLADLQGLLQNVKYAFFGHYHITSQITPQVHFIGTPLQHKWGERGVETRFLDIDLEAGTFKGINTQAPRFVEWQSLDEVDTAAIPGNFCRVKTDDVTKREEIRQFLLQYKPRGVDVPLIKKKVEQATRLGLDLTMSFQEMGTKMVEADADTKLDKGRIKKVMLEALTEASKRLA